MKSLTFIIGALIFASAGLPAATAQTGGPYDLTWNTFDGGGGTSAGGVFSVTGTIGQHDATVMMANGGNFTLAGGFWASGGLLCFVDLFDFSNFAAEWMLVGPGLDADLDNSNAVDGIDLAILVNSWLDPCPFGDWGL
jgi:hypothetical protein